MSDPALLPAGLANTSQPSDQMLWMADLLASYDAELPEAQEDDGSSHTGPTFETAAFEAYEAPSEDSEDEGVFEALFGWLIDWIEDLFGEEEDPVAEEPMSPPADVSEDLVFIPMVPDDDLLEELEDDIEDAFDI